VKNSRAGIEPKIPLLLILFCFDTVPSDAAAFYLVLTFLIFTLTMAVLLLIFLPKMMMQVRYAGMSTSDQKKLMNMALSARRSSIRRSVKDASVKDFNSVSGFMFANEVDAIRYASAQYSQVGDTNSRANSAVARNSSISIGHTESGSQKNETRGETQKSKPDSQEEEAIPMHVMTSNGSLKLKFDCESGYLSEKNALATALFLQILAMNNDGTKKSLEMFLRLVDRNKLSETEQSVLDATLLSLKDAT
jgi:hypothetical protein